MNRSFKLLVSLALGLLLLVGTGGAMARQHTHATTIVSLVPDRIYACPKCEMASARSGKCPGCKGAMAEIHGKYVFSCAKCKTVAAKGGNCSKCGKFMAKMVQTFACKKCHTTADKAGKCPKCGRFMAKKTLPMMK